jgi:hypothetical protein
MMLKNQSLSLTHGIPSSMPMMKQEGKMLYKKILVPHDGSKPADNASDHAIKLAKFCTKEGESIQIVLLYVVS